MVSWTIVLCKCVTVAYAIYKDQMTLCTTLSFSYTIVGTTKASQISRDGLSLHRLYAELSTEGPSPESNPNSPLPVNLFTLARNVNADFIITKIFPTHALARSHAPFLVHALCMLFFFFFFATHALARSHAPFLCSCSVFL